MCPSSARVKIIFGKKNILENFPPPPSEVTPMASDVQLFDVVNRTALSDVGLL